MFVYPILSTTPVWALFAFLFVLTYGALFVGRHIFEGVPYQVSYSAFIGDAGLLVAVMIAATILQRGHAIIPDWLTAGWVHIEIYFVALVACTITCIMTLKSRSGKLMDVYHDAVIGPVVIYFAVTLLPVIFTNGSVSEFGSTCVSIQLWVLCVIYDICGDRMNQRCLLERLGLRFPD